MSNDNNKEALNAANSGEINDEALEDVSGGFAEDDRDPETIKKFEELEAKLDREALIKANREAQILVDFEKKAAQESAKNSTGNMTDLTKLGLSR